MRVLNVLAGLPVGGIEITLLRCLPHLREHGIHSDVCVTTDALALADQYEAQGVSIHRIKNSFNPYLTARRFRQFLAEHNYSIVHSRFGLSSGGFVLGAAEARVPAVVSFHSTTPSLVHWDRRPGLSTVRRAWLGLHRRLLETYRPALIGHSKANLDAFNPNWRTYGPSVYCIRNGIEAPETLPTKEEARAILGVPPDRPMLLHVGSFKAHKNHGALIEIMSLVVKRYPNAHLYLLGQGAGRPKIEAKVREAGLIDRVHFEGARDPWTYYRAADVFVFPSFAEGFGNALAEAQLAETPIVATDIPGHREATAPSNRECLFPLGHNQRAAELIDAALRDRAPFSIEARRSARSYIERTCSVAEMARQLAQVYKAHGESR